MIDSCDEMHPDGEHRCQVALGHHGCHGYWVDFEGWRYWNAPPRDPLTNVERDYVEAMRGSLMRKGCAFYPGDMTICIGIIDKYLPAPPPKETR